MAPLHTPQKIKYVNLTLHKPSCGAQIRPGWALQKSNGQGCVFIVLTTPEAKQAERESKRVKNEVNISFPLG